VRIGLRTGAGQRLRRSHTVQEAGTKQMFSFA
jgi:hypothetical protein